MLLLNLKPFFFSVIAVLSLLSVFWVWIVLSFQFVGFGDVGRQILWVGVKKKFDTSC